VLDTPTEQKETNSIGTSELEKKEEEKGSEPPVTENKEVYIKILII
jgi:hypothetical protein